MARRPLRPGPSRRHEAARDRMVRRQILGRGVADAAVIRAMRSVPRHRFVAPELAAHAYDDSPLRIPEGQTISQPYIVATMAEAARLGPESTVLEIGTGSGYGAAVLSRCAGSVVTIERHPPLADSARALLNRLGYDNIEVIEGDGSRGHAARAPYDAIVVTAAASEIPPALLDQLADRGRLVMPVGTPRATQQLLVVERHGTELRRDDLGSVRFVPLVRGERDQAPGPIVLVEGESDRAAVEAAARVLDVDLSTASIVAMNGATNVGRFMRDSAEHGHDIAGLCDRGEVDFFVDAIIAAGLGRPASDEDLAALGFFVCDADLEQELIRAAEPDTVVAVAERAGDLRRLRTFQKQPEWLDRPLPDQLHRWLRSRSQRNREYATLLVEATPPDRLAPPLRDLVTHLARLIRPACM